MPSNPVINEQALLQQVRDNETPRTPDQMRWLCNMVLLAAHDRKVTREFFIEVVNCVAEIQGSLAQLISAGRMRHLLLKYDMKREPEVLDEAVDGLMQGLMRQKEKLEHLMEQIIECPTLADTIS